MDDIPCIEFFELDDSELKNFKPAKEIVVNESLEQPINIYSKPIYDSIVSAKLLTLPPTGEEVNIILAFSLAHLAWESMSRKDYENISKIHETLLKHGKISINTLTESITRILYKICDEHRINEKLYKIDKVYQKAIILVANQLLSIYSENAPPHVSEEKVIVPNKRPIENVRSTIPFAKPKIYNRKPIESIRPVISSSKATGSMPISYEKMLKSSENVQSFISHTKSAITDGKPSENVRSFFVGFPKTASLNRKSSGFVQPYINTVKATSACTKKPSETVRPYISSIKASSFTKKLIQSREKLKKVLKNQEKKENLSKIPSINKEMSTSNVKKRLEDLIQKAAELGLGDIKFPKGTYANDRAKLALLERQIKGKMKLQIIHSGIKLNKSKSLNTS